MKACESYPQHGPAEIVTDFREYLETSLRQPFLLDLQDCTLMEVIDACIETKRRMHPQYGEHLNGLKHNLRILERDYGITLVPVQVTEIFWGFFIKFCQGRGLKDSSTLTMCNQLRSVLSWATKYNARVSPTFGDFSIRAARNQEIALSADDVSRIAYFDIDRFYAGRRSDFRKTMHRVRDMFVLSCNLFQRHSDMLRIEPSCFERNVFRINQQKTGNPAVVLIDTYALDAKTTYRILKAYNYEAPYKASIGNYNKFLHSLMRDIGFTEPVRIEERGEDGKLVAKNVPKWKLISSHTARRTAITVNVLRGRNVHGIRRCSGHKDMGAFDRYIREDIDF